MKRKVLSFLLVISLLLGLLPITALAATKGSTSSTNRLLQKYSGSIWSSYGVKNVMRKDSASKTGGKVLGSKTARSKIKTITFLDTLDDAPAKAWDVSKDKDCSVLAWTEKNGDLYDLYIGGEGGVWAPKNASGLFCGYTKLTEINFDGNFHTEDTTSMSYLFSYCKKLEEVDVSDFDTSNVTRMECMFMHCYELEELDLSGFDIENVIDMGSMFWECSSLLELWMPDPKNCAKKCNTAYMFKKCDPCLCVIYTG